MQRHRRLRPLDDAHAALRGTLNRMQNLLAALVEQQEPVASRLPLRLRILSRSLEQLVAEAAGPLPPLFLFRRRTRPSTTPTSHCDFEATSSRRARRLQTGSSREIRLRVIPTRPSALS